MSKTQTLRPVRYFTDADGIRCALVPVANLNDSAIIYADDLTRLVADGVSLNWQLNSNGSAELARSYVKVSLPGKDGRVVARLVYGARPKEQVRYRNGNRLDLRRPNLTTASGGNAHKDCSVIASTCDVAAEGSNE
ncbi:hypothetical protein LY625_03685 [Lysobacter sp. GX 14042]|uniref:hypothetical protein n=1 Tax=Lysobacter sp. GX 14042 TaxID=2907155 RepID=UPI001F1B1B0E|nr:hypothetical protein [Lysobacter sp. GX 14042]MCE7031726.1 hypothetical protein [Lysobacter sp. GX 14042]